MARDFTGDSSKWDRTTNTDFQTQVREAREDAMSHVDASVPCTNWGGPGAGSVNSDCECQNCTGNRAAYAKQVQLTNPQEWAKKTGRERARLTIPMKEYKKLSERDRLSDEDFNTRFPASERAEAPEDLNPPNPTPVVPAKP